MTVLWGWGKYRGSVRDAFIAFDHYDRLSTCILQVKRHKSRDMLHCHTNLTH